jgi:hypothetical protein
MLVLLFKLGREKKAEALMWGELTVLNLGGCELDDDGAVIVAAFVKVDDTVEEVYLHGNDFGPSGAKVIADALKHNKTVRILNLSGNKIGQVCVCDFPLLTWRMGMSFRLAPRSVVSAA